MAVNSVGMQDLLSALSAAREALGKGLQTTPASAPAQAGAPDFAELLKNSLQHVDQSQAKADTMMREFQLGNPKVSLEDTMVAMQKANIEFQEVVQVRNRVVAAYHDIMNMNV